jgi:hypothetical protein
MGLQSCGEAERRSDRAGLAAGRITGYPEISTKRGYVQMGHDPLGTPNLEIARAERKNTVFLPVLPYFEM